MKYTLTITILSLTLLLGCTEKKHKTSDDALTPAQKEEVNYIAKGLEYVVNTQALLAGNLMSAIQEKGTVEAIEFCNIEAIPLTDSLVKDIEMTIKRVSDQPRNPNNRANEDELAYIQKGKEALKNDQNIMPFLKEHDEKMTVYYPIFTHGLCMQCHGSTTDAIQPEVLAKLNQLYPDDEATGYSENELRGIWVVEMNKEH
ncbi:MAG: DUF3365 domain-containing protein [Chitinophagales bacterium]